MDGADRVVGVLAGHPGEDPAEDRRVLTEHEQVAEHGERGEKPRVTVPPRGDQRDDGQQRRNQSDVAILLPEEPAQLEAVVPRVAEEGREEERPNREWRGGELGGVGEAQAGCHDRAGARRDARGGRNVSPRLSEMDQ